MRRAGAGIVVGVLLAALAACSSDGSSGGHRTSTTAGAASGSVSVVSQNLLHGTACAADSNRCDLPARAALFTRQLAAAHCPAVVAVQETNRETRAALAAALPGVCDDRYSIVYDDDPAADRELVVTTEKVLASERVRLAGPLRTALWVRLDTAVGPLDLVTTHLASDSDDRPCDATSCVAPCKVSDSIQTCQAREAADLLDARRGPRSVGVLAGDLNATTDQATIAVLRDRGYVDTHLAAGNTECDPTTGADCTSGREDTDLSDMRNAGSKQHERIDYIFLSTKRSCIPVPPTGVFAPSGGPAADDGIVFPSDHSGVEATLRCRTGAADRAAGGIRPEIGSTSTSRPAAEVSDATRAAVTAAFENVYAMPDLPPAQRLESLERGQEFLESFVARINALGPTATQTSVRIDDLRAVDHDTVDVTYSILLNGSVVLDALPGQAKRAGDEWIVTAKTYCAVATLGTKDVPAPCR